MRNFAEHRRPTCVKDILIPAVVRPRSLEPHRVQLCLDVARCDVVSTRSWARPSSMLSERNLMCARIALRGCSASPAALQHHQADPRLERPPRLPRRVTTQHLTSVFSSSSPSSSRGSEVAVIVRDPAALDALEGHAGDQDLPQVRTGSGFHFAATRKIAVL